MAHGVKVDTQPPCRQSVEGQSFVSRPGFIQPFPVMPRSATLATPSNGVWSEASMLHQQQHASINVVLTAAVQS
ncbi:hypothetical protein SLE2022_029610 [Rubroshorea leprosula]